MTDLERAGAAELVAAFGDGDRPATGEAPGRCTLVGEHVDYADGLVLATAIDLHVAVAVRRSADGIWRAASRGRRVERHSPAPTGDIGDRLFAAATALSRAGVDLPVLELGVAATLPESAGLSSSAAVVSAALVAMLRMAHARLDVGALASTALVAERDIVGVPCGPLDQRTVAGTRRGAALLLDCRSGIDRPVPWHVRGTVMVAVYTGDRHDVGGRAYRARRREAAEALRALGVGSYRDVDEEWVDAVLDGIQARRARHIVSETVRAGVAAAALGAGDAAALGRLMSASHASLRDDYEVSTRALDAVVAAAQGHPGCLGARMVGGGFGGTVVALVEEAAAGGCTEAMRSALPPGGPGARSFALRPAPGLVVTAGDAVSG